MSPFFNLLFFIFVDVIIEREVESFLFKGNANISGSPPDDGFYNIYSKIDYLEKVLKNMETSVQQKETHMDTLLRQVLLTVNEMDAKIESSGSLKIESGGLQNFSIENGQLQALTKNVTEVGFTTKLTGSYTSLLINIRGHNIQYNGGNAYNGTVFTCPSPGLYLFHVSLITTTIWGSIWIYKNSDRLTVAYAGNDPQYNSASASAVVWLDVGDQVYLRSSSSSLSVDSNSVFTGAKVN